MAYPLSEGCFSPKDMHILGGYVLSPAQTDWKSPVKLTPAAGILLILPQMPKGISSYASHQSGIHTQRMNNKLDVWEWREMS